MDEIKPEQVEQLIEELKLPPGDLYLFGDGSGTTLNLPCAHFVCLYEPSFKKVQTFHAGYSNGTNNFAELMPYVHALWAYDAARPKEGKKQKIKVVIVSDSELTVRCAIGQYTRNANLPLWAAIDWFCSNGYEVSWHHVRRNSNFLMELADKRAGEVRRCIIYE